MSCQGHWGCTGHFTEFCTRQFPGIFCVEEQLGVIIFSHFFNLNKQKIVSSKLCLIYLFIYATTGFENRD